MGPKARRKLIDKLTANCTIGDTGLPDLTNDPVFKKEYELAKEFVERVGLENAMKLPEKKKKLWYNFFHSIIPSFLKYKKA
jgi:hypothetical protein